MDTQDAGVTLIRSIAKLKPLKFDARSLYFERASYPQSWTWWVQKFLFAFWHTSSLSNCSQVLFLLIPCEVVYGEGIYLCEGSVAKRNDAFVGWLFVYVVDCLRGQKPMRGWKVYLAFNAREYSLLVYTKTVDSVFRALWLATQSVSNLHYSGKALSFWLE